MSLKLPNLKILNIESLVRHEWHDQQRTPPLIDRLRASGFLRNPPIVTPFLEDEDRYVVLDGANRTFALQKMGVPHVIAQVVDSKDPNLQLKTWNHVLCEMKGVNLIENLRKIDGLETSEITKDQKSTLQMNWDNGKLVQIETSDGKIWLVSTKSKDLVQKVDGLNLIVNAYKTHAKMDRTPSTSINEISELYENLCGMVVFPPFDVADILQMCIQGTLVPAGITRFTISPRALRVNYPLDNLSARKNLDEKKRSLERWVQERVARRGVRVYPEATVLFDE